MYSLKQSKGFNGVDVVLYEEELNILIDSIDKNIEEASHKFMPEFVDKMESLKRVLCEYAYYDQEEKEVHCRMGYYELQLTIEILFSTINKQPTNHFDKIIEDPKTKKWTHKN